VAVNQQKRTQHGLPSMMIRRLAPVRQILAPRRDRAFERVAEVRIHLDQQIARPSALLLVARRGLVGL
jgi:hypothetical protein